MFSERPKFPAAFKAKQEIWRDRIMDWNGRLLRRVLSEVRHGGKLMQGCVPNEHYDEGY
jgi:hypothetical protein